MSTLQTAMIGNALFSSFSATSFLLLKDTIATSTNIPAIVLELIGLSLFGFVALLLYGIFGARQKTVGGLAIWLDWTWVIGSVLALLLPLNSNGRIGIVVIAVLVAGFALWQQRGIATIGRA
jgi:hypothetical protein